MRSYLCPNCLSEIATRECPHCRSGEQRDPVGWLRGFAADHDPDGWPAVRMRDITAVCAVVDELQRENARLREQLSRLPTTIWRHRKTGKLYRWLAAGIDQTTSRAGTPVVVYCPDDNEHTVYVWEREQFEAKFEEVP